MSLCHSQTWTDVQLQWNPEKFSGLTMMRIPVDRIWTPDIVLYNTWGSFIHLSIKHTPLLYRATHGDYYITGTQAMVLSNGTVHWSPHGVFNSFCQPDFSYFPFDTQVKKCSVSSTMIIKSHFTGVWAVIRVLGVRQKSSGYPKGFKWECTVSLSRKWMEDDQFPIRSTWTGLWCLPISIY